MSENETIGLDLPASHKYLNVLAACLTAMLERAFEEAASDPAAAHAANSAGSLRDLASVMYDIKLAAHEICTNIIDHAYGGQPGGRIQIRLALEQRLCRLVIEICDAGEPFDPSQAPEPDLEHGQIHGYGLFLVRQLMDEVAYEPQPGGNRWRLIKNC